MVCVYRERREMVTNTSEEIRICQMCNCICIPIGENQFGTLWAHKTNSESLSYDLDQHHRPTPDPTDKEESKSLKFLNGALKDCINTHGAIKKDYVSSASKRILGMFKNNVVITVIPEDFKQQLKKIEQEQQT